MVRPVCVQPAFHDPRGKRERPVACRRLNDLEVQPVSRAWT